MKTVIHALLLPLAFALASCSTMPEKPFPQDDPLVTLTRILSEVEPVTCPKCGKPPTLQRTVYECEQGHRFDYAQESP